MADPKAEHQMKWPPLPEFGMNETPRHVEMSELACTTLLRLGNRVQFFSLVATNGSGSPWRVSRVRLPEPRQEAAPQLSTFNRARTFALLRSPSGPKSGSKMRSGKPLSGSLPSNATALVVARSAPPEQLQP